MIARAKREAELKKTKLMEDVRHDMIMAASITACKLAAETLDDKKQAYIFRKCWMRWVNQHGRIN